MQVERGGESLRGADRGSLAPGAATHHEADATGTSWYRSVAGENLARVRGSTARRVCPRVEFGCRSRRTTSSSEKRAPGGKGARGREPNSAGFARDPRGAKGVDNRHLVAKPWRRGRPEPDARKGLAGAKVFARWKALQVVSPVARSREQQGGGLGGSHDPVHARASRVREGGDRGVRGKASTRHDGKTTPDAMKHP